MKKLLLLMLSISWLGLSAQTPTVAQPSSTGVSDAFRNYAKTNAAKLSKSLKAGAAGTQEAGIQEEDADVEVPNHFYIERGGGENVGLASKASLAKTEAISLSVATSPSSMYTQTTNGTLPVTKVTDYVGLGNGFPGWTLQNLLPPDTTMAVGNNQIVQWVNVRLTVLNKTTGSPLLPAPGYVTGSQIWSGLGSTSLCKNFNRGDPVLQYDRMAGRWLLSQFAFNGTAATSSFAMCFAVSKTSDATGAYNLYEYSNNPYLPDYPKLGVWTDAYYWTANDFDFRTNPQGDYAGTRDCALDRAAMLAGNSANMICFAGLGVTTGEYFASLPADFEGSIAPPANSAQYILNVDWFSKNNPPYFMELRRFHPDFINPGNSTLDDGFGGGPGSFVSMPFANNVVGACGDGGGACVTQPGTTRRLDTLSMRPMYRLAYRNMGSNRESLVFTESVDPTGSAVAGIQLVEIRSPGANPPVVYNNVNFNPDATNRWMGAAATDKVGNILLGYSASSGTVPPSIRIAGRQRNDIKSTLRGEIEVKTGAGNQTSSSSRWGDYSTMQIDPDDDCTFWYTQEYTNVSSSANWATHIVGYKFNNCQ